VKEFGDRALFVKEAGPYDAVDSFWTELRDPPVHNSLR
jgi:hypothetical protein